MAENKCLLVGRVQPCRLVIAMAPAFQEKVKEWLTALGLECDSPEVRPNFFSWLVDLHLK